MGKTINDLIIQKELNLNKVKLNLESSGLTSLEGIEKFSRLKELDLSYNNITSINGIDRLTKLEKLQLDYNDLTSLKGIEGLINLKILTCSYNKLESLTGIEKLVKIETLICEGNQLNDLSGIENLSELKAPFIFYRNPCWTKYSHCKTIEEIRKQVIIENCLQKENTRRGEASIIDTGLFDFYKLKKGAY